MKEYKLGAFMDLESERKIKFLIESGKVTFNIELLIYNRDTNWI